MNELSLFSGIAGISLGLKRACAKKNYPFRTVGYVEKDEYCQKVLEARIRDKQLDFAPIFSDVKTFDGKPWRGKVDIITGGFPCQDISIAGKGAGLDGKRSGLFFELWRIVREVRPPLVLLENVPAILTRGLDVVTAEMAASGYDCQWDCIPASSLGASHRRDRWFAISYPFSVRQHKDKIFQSIDSKSNRNKTSNIKMPKPCRTFDFDGHRYRKIPGNIRMDNDISSIMDRVKSSGNAVVPQVVEHIGECLIDWLTSDSE